MTSFEEYRLSVCEVCLHLLANGEYNDGTDAAERANDAMIEKWGEDTKHLIPGSEEFGFSTSECDTCGDDLHGNRHEAIALIPKT